MLTLNFTTQYKRDVKLAKKRGKKLGKLDTVITSLLAEKPLEAKYQDHPLTGDYIGHRECHIEPDWLLIYYNKAQQLVLVRTGTHSDLF